MNSFSSSLKVLSVVGCVVVAGVFLGWLGTRNSGDTAPTAVRFPELPTNTTSARVSTPKPDPLLPQPSEGGLRQQFEESGAAPQVQPIPPDLITNWEDRIDSILTSDEEEAKKAKRMLEMFPRLPAEGQEEVAQHLSNLVPDEDYSALGQYLTNATLPESVLDVLLSDLLNRPNSIKLPLLMQVARDARNPESAEAKDLLGVFLEEDYGDNWPAWQTKMDQWLKENPD